MREHLKRERQELEVEIRQWEEEKRESQVLRDEKVELSTKLEEAYAYARHYKRKYQLAAGRRQE